MLIYDHTLVLISPRTLFCIHPSKEFLSKISIFKKPLKNLFLGLVRSTARSTAGRAELLCRSTGQSIDMHLCACVHIGRPTGRPRSRAVLSVFPRSTGPVNRQRELTLGLGFGGPAWSTAFPTVGNPTVGGRPSRSTDSSQSLLTDSNGYFLIWFLLGSPPTNLLAFLTQFSSPINRGSVLQLKHKIYKIKIKSFQKFSLLAKSFLWAKFPILLAWSLPLLLF